MDKQNMMLWKAQYKDKEETDAEFKGHHRDDMMNTWGDWDQEQVMEGSRLRQRLKEPEMGHDTKHTVMTRRPASV